MNFAQCLSRSSRRSTGSIVAQASRLPACVCRTQTGEMGRSSRPGHHGIGGQDADSDRLKPSLITEEHAQERGPRRGIV